MQLPAYIDDVGTPGDAILWRYIDVERYLKDDGTASSGAFRTKRLSVYVVAAEAAPGVTTETALRAKFPPGSRFQSFTAKQARDAGCIVVRIPDDDDDQSHREICPVDDPQSTLRKEADQLKRAASWVQGDGPTTTGG